MQSWKKEFSKARQALYFFGKNLVRQSEKVWLANTEVQNFYFRNAKLQENCVWKIKIVITNNNY